MPGIDFQMLRMVLHRRPAVVHRMLATLCFNNPADMRCRLQLRPAMLHHQGFVADLFQTEAWLQNVNENDGSRFPLVFMHYEKPLIGVRVEDYANQDTEYLVIVSVAHLKAWTAAMSGLISFLACAARRAVAALRRARRYRPGLQGCGYSALLECLQVD